VCTELRNRLLQNDLPYCVTHVFFQVPRSSADVAQDSEPVAEHRDVAPPTISDNADPFVPFRSYTQRIVTLMRDLLGQLCRGTLSSALKFPDDATLLDMYSAFDALPLPTEASAPQSRSAKNAKKQLRNQVQGLARTYACNLDEDDVYACTSDSNYVVLEAYECDPHFNVRIVFKCDSFDFDSTDVSTCNFRELAYLSAFARLSWRAPEGTPNRHRFVCKEVRRAPRRYQRVCVEGV